MGRQYFGTDGIRGTVGEAPITPDFMLKLGWAAGRVLSEGGQDLVLIGKDTRISGYMFESALEAGLSSAGVNTRMLGPMPTPAIAYLTRTFHACAGIVISASHNPYYDNGIKFFSGDGFKLPDEVEARIEDELQKPLSCVDSASIGKVARVEDAPGRYIEFCKHSLPLGMDLKGMDIVVDCAHGATYHIAPSVFQELGAKVHKIGVSPDGLNINVDCGSTKPELLRKTVIERGAHLGIAFDGDGDRVLFVDRNGDVVDGDELLYIIARSRKRQGQMRGPVVGTLMSNLGLEQAIKAAGMEFRRAKVGDRYVLEQLQKEGGILGGESSGHLICLDRTTTGDGVVAALQVLAALIDEGISLQEARAHVRKCPQCMVNVKVGNRDAISQSDAIKKAVAEVEKELGSNGRVLLRPSGTEPLVRVMVEGHDVDTVTALANRLADVVRQAAA
jgi:phosphoglucosamine mutase